MMMAAQTLIRRILRWLAPPVGYFLISLLGLAVCWRQIAVCATPHGGWVGALFTFTMAYPLRRVHEMPPHPGDLLGSMALQSIVCGLILSLMLHEGRTTTFRHVAMGRVLMALRLLLAVFAVWVGIGLLTFFSAFEVSYHYQGTRIAHLPDRINSLSRFIKIPGTVLDTDYSCSVDSGLGPSSFDYFIAVKVPVTEVDQWRKVFTREPTLQPKSSYSTYLRDWRTVFLNVPGWRPVSSPDIYYDGIVSYEIVYRKEGIILLKLLSN